MNLDAQQLEAVRTDSPCALVLAGPGAGKTRVIVERTAYLIEECKISPYEIVLLTFTRRAANEMRQRLKERIGKSATYNLTIGTFHAVALKLLHRFGELIGFRKENSTVYGEFEEQFLLKEVAKDLGVYKKSWKPPKKDIDAAFSRYYSTGVEPEKDDPAYSLFMAFMQRARENNSYTYGGLLTGLKLLLPKIHQYLHWKHVIADEQQDNDSLQWELIRTIQDLCGAAVFCVADIDQAIFAWRGAQPDYLIKHQGAFDTYLLESNYRSVAPIVEGANRLIGHNRHRIGKTMWATREVGQSRIVTIENSDSAELADTIKFCTVIGIGVNDKDSLAVLARNHALLRRLSEELTARDVPHVYIGKRSALTNSEEFRRFHAFLKLLVNPHDNFSFLLVKDFIGITPEQYRDIRVDAVTDGCSHLVAAHSLLRADCQEFFYERLRRVEIELAYAIAREWEILDEASRTEEIFAFLNSWIMSNPNGTVKSYLDWLATYDIQDELTEKTDELTLMTIHAAKGLEWPSVIVAGCNEGILPSKQAAAADEVEEERRLMYVAMTRARDQLILAIRPERQEKEDGRVYENPRSRFVGEAGL